MSRPHSKDQQGFCASCRILYCWLNEPVQSAASCPVCRQRLGRKPRGRAAGRFAIHNRTPLSLTRPELVLREVRNVATQQGEP
jgi:hypothetical protein